MFPLVGGKNYTNRMNECLQGISNHSSKVIAVNPAFILRL